MASYLTRKRLLKGFFGGLILVGVLFFFFYQFLMKGEPYLIASEFIKSSKIVNEKLGATNQISLSFNSSLSYRGARGSANYKLFVKGVKSNGTVYLYMEKRVGIWKVREANLFLPDDSHVNIMGNKGEIKGTGPFNGL